MSERKRESLDTLICHTKEARLCQQSAVPSAAREQRDVSVRSVSTYRKGGFARAGVAPPFEFKMYMSAGSQPAPREPLELKLYQSWLVVVAIVALGSAPKGVPVRVEAKVVVRWLLLIAWRYKLSQAG